MANPPPFNGLIHFNKAFVESRYGYGFIQSTSTIPSPARMLVLTCVGVTDMLRAGNKLMPGPPRRACSCVWLYQETSLGDVTGFKAAAEMYRLFLLTQDSL